MQSWSPAQGSGIGVLCALPITLAVLVHSHGALGFGESWGRVPYESVSTLDAYVPQHDWAMQEAVLDLVESGILLGRKPVPFRAPTLVAPQGSRHEHEAEADRPQPDFQDANSSLEDAKVPTPAQPQAFGVDAGVAAGDGSPFRRWVKPQEIAVDSGRARVEKDKPDFVAAKPDFGAKSESELERALPLPRPARKNTAVASDLSVADAPGEDELAGDDAPRRSGARPRQTMQPPQFLNIAPNSANAASPSADLPPLSKSRQNLRRKIRSVLTHYYNRPLNTRDRSPWELMHAMLAFEAHSKVLQGGPRGEPITAVGWLCFNQACKRRKLMYVNDEGELSVRVGPALQGHRGQLLALLAQSRINENYPMLVEGEKLKVADLIEMEKRTCYPRTELTFKLIGLMHYLDSDEKWLNDQGMEWSIPKLIAEELRQPVRGAACGGTHRLSGLTLAYKTRSKRGEPVENQYLKAKQFVTRYQQYAYRLQNRDGSFSTEWFRGPGNEDDLDRKLKTTGHILEWLLYAASHQELHHWRTTKAVNFLANTMYNNRYKDWEAGPLGHAIHALLVYDRLVFSPYDPANQPKIARQPAALRPSRRKR